MNIASAIDHTLLKPEATERQIRALCSEAKQYQFASACVNPCWVPLVAKLLQSTAVKTCSVIGFPLGASATSTKVFEATQAVRAGAGEVDMVINIGWLKGNQLAELAEDISGVRKAVPPPVILKVIIESAILTNDEIRAVSEICVTQGVDFVKTSTGMHAGGGAKVEHVELIRGTVGNRAQIKASGGIRTLADVTKFLDAGASRIGCSSSVQIMQEASCQKVA